MVVFDVDYCPHCGASLADAGDGHYEFPSCDRAVYRNVVPAASVAVVREDGGVLCIQRGHPLRRASGRSRRATSNRASGRPSRLPGNSPRRRGWRSTRTR